MKIFNIKILGLLCVFMNSCSGLKKFSFSTGAKTSVSTTNTSGTFSPSGEMTAKINLRDKTDSNKNVITIFTDKSSSKDNINETDLFALAGFYFDFNFLFLQHKNFGFGMTLGINGELNGTTGTFECTTQKSNQNQHTWTPLLNYEYSISKFNADIAFNFIHFYSKKHSFIWLFGCNIGSVDLEFSLDAKIPPKSNLEKNITDATTTSLSQPYIRPLFGFVYAHAFSDKLKLHVGLIYRPLIITKENSKTNNFDNLLIVIHDVAINVGVEFAVYDKELDTLK